MRKLLLLTLSLKILNPFHLFAADEGSEKPFVTIHLSGQLGNQLFQVAAASAQAWDHNMVAIIPELNREDMNIPLNYRKIFFRVNASPLPRPILNHFGTNGNCNYDPIPHQIDQTVWGYFQTWQYFDHHREKILDLFAPRTEDLTRLKTRHAEILNHPYTVAIHVRTVSKYWSYVIPFVGLEYYEKALKHFPPEALFVVFSDRIGWCKHHFKKFNRPMVFIEGQDHVDDLFLMSMMRHDIISSSTFSWWGAYLNRNPDKIVVGPSHFINPAVGGPVNGMKPEWIKIDIDYNYERTPYPTDIDNYPTTSVD